MPEQELSSINTHLRQVWSHPDIYGLCNLWKDFLFAKLHKTKYLLTCLLNQIGGKYQMMGMSKLKNILGPQGHLRVQSFLVIGNGNFFATDAPISLSPQNFTFIMQLSTDPWTFSTFTHSHVYLLNLSHQWCLSPMSPIPVFHVHLNKLIRINLWKFLAKFVLVSYHMVGSQCDHLKTGPMASI